MTKVFVYGTLLTGYGNWSWHLEDEKCLGEAETLPEYTMLHLGGFPGVIEGGDTAIKGEIFEVGDEVLKGLDRLEGVDKDNPEQGLYRSKEVTLANGEEVLIYIYNNRRGWADNRVIKSGSWREAQPLRSHRSRNG